MITLFFLFWYAHVVSLINVLCCYCLFMEISCDIIDSSSKRKQTFVTHSYASVQKESK